MILAVCLNPTMQKTLVFDAFLPGEVNRVAEQRVDASGKGVNVARVATELGGRALHLTHLGGRYAEQFRALCSADGLELAVVPSPSEIRWCTTIVDRQEHTTTEIVEPTEPVPEETEDLLYREYERVLRDAAIAVFSGTAAPGYREDLFPRMVRAARELGIPVIADYRGAPLRATLDAPEGMRPTVVKPNLKEFAETFLFGGGAVEGGAVVSEHSTNAQLLARVEKQMHRIAAGGTHVILTRGSLPALLVSPGGTVVTAPATALEAVNTIGCGDAFTAGLAVALLDGASLDEAVHQGHTAAAMNAVNLKPGSIRPV